MSGCRFCQKSPCQFGPGFAGRSGVAPAHRCAPRPRLWRAWPQVWPATKRKDRSRSARRRPPSPRARDRLATNRLPKPTRPTSPPPKRVWPSGPPAAPWRAWRPRRFPSGPQFGHSGWPRQFVRSAPAACRSGCGCLQSHDRPRCVPTASTRRSAGPRPPGFGHPTPGHRPQKPRRARPRSHHPPASGGWT